MLFSYLFLLTLSVFIFTVTETQARPHGHHEGRSTPSSSPTTASALYATPTISTGLDPNSVNDETFNALVSFLEIVALMDSLLVDGVRGVDSNFSAQLDNTTIPNLRDQLALASGQFDLGLTAIGLQLANRKGPAIAINSSCAFFTGNETNFAEVVTYFAAASAAGIKGTTAKIMEDAQLPPSLSNFLFNSMGVLSRIQTLTAQEAFGLGSGMLDGLIAPTLTSFETELALIPLLGDCDFDLEFTGQDDNFVLVPQVSLLSDSGDTLLPPFIFPNNTQVQIDPTSLLDSDNCSASNVFCQIIALQDLDANLNPTVTVMPLQECTVAADGMALIYVTSNDTPLLSAFDDRLAMTNESICAVSTLVYVNTIDELIQEVAGNLTSSS